VEIRYEVAGSGARQRKPDVSLAVVPGVGQFLRMQDPHEFNRLLACAVKGRSLLRANGFHPSRARAAALVIGELMPRQDIGGGKGDFAGGIVMEAFV
jgi:hypothetical protein